jgi:poly-gamma-glutamate synthase PgsB/CapB
MNAIVLAAGCLAVFLGYLALERIVLERRLRRIPLRILVAGTRGKSSVVRLVAAAMREAGYRTVAKTTGSRPVIIDPDGEERVVQRRGQPTITEGKKLIKIGADLGAQALVAEMMSIQPESSFVESHQIIQPQIVALTNVRVDHIGQMGRTRERVAQCLATAISDNATLLLPEEESHPIFAETARTIIRVPATSCNDNVDSFEFEENRALATAVTDYLEIDGQTALRGMRKAQPDLGSLRAWTLDVKGRRLHLASLFAANDPDSTRRALDWLLKDEGLPRENLHGLLALRRDRGDRSLQWLDALTGDRFPELDGLFLIGGHASLLASRLKKRWSGSVRVLRDDSPERITAELAGKVTSDSCFVGMGNMGGVGKRLVEHWSRVGRRL